MSVDKQSGMNPPLWTKNFITILFVNLFVFLSFQMLLPTMPMYAQSLGVSEDLIGLVVGIFTITAVVLRPLAGKALDTIGRRPVLFFGLIIIIFAILGYRFVPTVALLLSFRLLHGIGWGVGSTASGTIVSDMIPNQRMGEGMGFFGLTTTFSMAIAPALGISVVNRWGFDTLFYGSACLAVLGAMIAMSLTFEPLVIPTGLTKQNLKTALFEKKAYRPTLMIFFITLTYGAVVAFIALYAKSFGIVNIGFFFTSYAVALLFARPFFGKLADRKGFNYAIIPGMILIAVTMLTLYLAQGVPSFILAAFLYGIGFGAVQPSLQAMAVIKVPTQRRGAANGTFMSGFDLGIGVGSIFWGYVVTLVGYQTMYLLAVTPVLVAIIYYLWTGRK